MKKHLIATASALALIASPVWANDSDIDQIGESHGATVDQTGGIEGVSAILQNGEGHSASVTQSDAPAGSPQFDIPSNSSTISQFGAGATATVEQIGLTSADPGNISTITQYSSAAPQTATLTQQGSENVSTITQGRDALDRNGQIAEVRQTGVANDSLVDQRGNRGNALVEQFGDYNTSTVTETGADNMATVRQLNSGNTSDVIQSANSGVVEVLQSGASNTSWVEQSGRANFSTASLIEQSGDNNRSMVTQTSLVAGRGSSNQMASVLQESHDNDSVIHQDGGEVVALTGDQGNTATVSQTATSGNFSDIRQSGAGNVAAVYQ